MDSETVIGLAAIISAGLTISIGSLGPVPRSGRDARSRRRWLPSRNNRTKPTRFPAPCSSVWQ